MQILANFGGQVVAVVGLFHFLLSSYQEFKYEMEALSSLYFFKSKPDTPLVNDTEDKDAFRQDLKEKV